jgi:hypothetical protein
MPSAMARGPAMAGPLLVQAAGEIADAKCGLLAVVLQHHVASLGQLGAVLLQAGENGEVALIDHRTAVTLNIAGTGRLLLGRSATLLRDGGGGDRHGQQDQSQERFVHSVPSFEAENSRPDRTRYDRTEVLNNAAERSNGRTEALANAAKFTAPKPGMSPPMRA